MAKFRIYAAMTISTCETVEADSFEEAVEKKYQEGWHKLMFLDHRYPDEGEWEIDETDGQEPLE